MQFLDKIGANWMLEENYIDKVIGYVVEKGKVFHGYKGFYCYNNIGYAELICHILTNDEGKNEVQGFSTSVMGNNFWNVIIGDRQVAEEYVEDEDELSKVIFCRKEDEDRQVSVRLIHADVLPSFDTGEKVTMQVVAFPHSINYYESEDVWYEKHGTKIMGNYVRLENGTILSMGLDDSSLVKGCVKYVDKRFTFTPDGERIEFLEVGIDTYLGELSICHAMDMVDEEERSYIKPGACVYTVCTIQGDVAIGEYQRGAVFDEEHDLKVLKGCFERNDFSRVEKMLADNVCYQNMKGIVDKNGKDTVLNYLNKIGINRSKENEPIFANYGKITKVFENGNEKYLNKKGLLLSYDTKSCPAQIFLIDVNDEGKIEKIIVLECDDYRFTIAGERINDVNEESLLNVLKEGIDSGNCIPLLPYLHDKAGYWEDGKVIFAPENEYKVIRALDVLLRYNLQNDLNMETYLVRVKGVKNDDDIVKYDFEKKALALSYDNLDNYTALLFLEIDCNGTILRINAVNNKNYIVEEFKPSYDICSTHYETHHNFLKIERTEQEWLEFLKDWAVNKDVEELIFYSGMEPDCTLIIDRGNHSQELKGKEDVYANIKVYMNFEYPDQIEIVQVNDLLTLDLDRYILSLKVSERNRIIRIHITGK